ncbi:tetratricopeptide repeat protein [Spirosoma sp. KNUC1025]|uniref:tetratricopeptide repeat protein n=1 Tax=Spirosoma sp. KNUC1025 TaxID=2894082 RepID=UPI00386CA092|nr:tetratricopeptide repeat protein [Spirosoma sp. KNUC1025]
MSSIYRALHNPDAALVYNEQAQRYFPNNARLYYGRGLIYHAARKLDSALVCYARTVTLQPTYYQADFQMGLINQAYRRYYAALANYQRVQQLRPQFPRIDTYIGYCYEQLGQYALAIEAYSKATQQNVADRQAAAGLWRSQRRQYSRNSLLLPETANESVDASKSRTELDTSRVRISTIQPKARVTTGSGDSLRRSVKPIN